MDNSTEFLVEFLERFWLKNEEVRFSAIEIALYHYLMIQITKGKDRHTNIKITDVLSTSEKTFLKARATLIKHKLIDYQAGNRAEITKYVIGSFQ